MAGETASISRIAEIISKDIFRKLGWETIGVANKNFTCIQQEKHERKTAKTHPTDVVYFYKHPRTGIHEYFLTDVKNLCEKGIRGKTRNAIKEIDKSLDCAIGSQEWKNRYLLDPTHKGE